MVYVELPELLNCYHRGVYSPVVIRLEGGNNKGGFCIEEYKDAPPLVGLYGDMRTARSLFEKTVNALPAFIFSLIAGDTKAEGTRNPHQSWFMFEFHPLAHRISFYCGPQGIKLDRLSDAGNKDLRAALLGAHSRLMAIYRRFYNV